MSHERKFLDTQFASTTALTAGSTCWNADGFFGPAGSAATPLNNACFTNIQAGTGPTNRIGSQVVADQLILRFRIIPTGSTTGLNNHLRLIVFADNECDGAYPSGAEILTYFGATQPANSLAFLELGYGGRFSIMMDENIILKESAYWNGSAEVVSSFDATLYHEKIIDLKSHKINWDMTGSSAVANYRQGHIFILGWWCTQTQSAGVISTAYNNAPHVQGLARLRFRDTNSA